MPTRREFLESTAALAAALGVDLDPWPMRGRERPGQEAAPQNPGPDFAVVNARVYTMDAAQPRAQAFAVKNGRTTAVGSSSDIRNLATRGTQVLDAGGMTVVPGSLTGIAIPAA